MVQLSVDKRRWGPSSGIRSLVRCFDGDKGQWSTAAGGTWLVVENHLVGVLENNGRG